MMRRFLGDSTRTEPALRLWLFVALCGMLSTLLLVALVMEDAVNGGNDTLLRWNSVASPVFVGGNVSSLLNVDSPTSSHLEAKSKLSQMPTMGLVETLPVGDCALQSSLPQTFDTLLRHTNQATTSIDISAMYWNLLGAEDRKVYSDAEMLAFGADRGTQLFQALTQALKRGVVLRIVTSATSISGGGASALPDELQQLVATAPQQVHVRQWSGQQWYGGGILHQKIWIFDKQHIYVGSANMDWKSLAQVMEIGVCLEQLTPSSPVMQDFQKLFDVWWLWCALDPHAVNATLSYESQKFQATFKVPSWSSHLPEGSRTHDPFARASLQAHGNEHNQLHASFVNGSSSSSAASAARLFVASSPVESTVERTRTFDEDALVYTIHTAQERVDLSVMDFTPYSMYPLETHKDASIWWPALTEALLAGVYGKKGLRVRLLISQWQHSHAEMFTALSLVSQQATLCKQQRHAKCGGSLEIKIFRVPGWQNTTTHSSTKPPLWPAFTRVNHAKYIVTDTRVNIGTSNMEWSYFYTTAGLSVNTDHEPTRQAMENVFNRNWASPYAMPLSKVLAEEDDEEQDANP